MKRERRKTLKRTLRNVEINDLIKDFNDIGKDYTEASLDISIN